MVGKWWDASKNTEQESKSFSPWKVATRNLLDNFLNWKLHFFHQWSTKNPALSWPFLSGGDWSRGPTQPKSLLWMENRKICCRAPFWKKGKPSTQCQMLFCFLFKNHQAETLVALSLNEAKNCCFILTQVSALVSLLLNLKAKVTF